MGLIPVGDFDAFSAHMQAFKIVVLLIFFLDAVRLLSYYITSNPPALSRPREKQNKTKQKTM